MTDQSLMTPAQINRFWAKKSYTGSLGVFTMVSGNYQWYLPMFFDRLAKELPEAEPLVYVRGEVVIPEPWASKCLKPEGLPTFSGKNEGYTTAALRYVYSDTNIESHDYVFITDCDMLHMAEDPSLINQHMRHLNRFGLGCYSNYVSAWVNAKPRCPGIHFVTQKWWKQTAESRKTELESLVQAGCSPSWEHDELMLGKIVVCSGLEMTSEQALWAHHGIHLGDWRRRIQMKHQYPPPGASHQTYIRKLLADPKFMEIVDLCAPHLDKMNETIDLFKKI